MKKSVEKLLHMLVKICEDEKDRMNLIRNFQDAVWGIKESGDELDALSDLAYDLDFYQQDATLREEDSSYFGDDRLLDEINSTFLRIDQIEKK